ncbi:vomeronasal type-1 receptor 4-like [Phacochoerus africanus]|uniref:vomeronasal type-1 receptor 4-like n=1 Tax=Phacochoerus africanus TaxID=41426 RepID=UPI001FD922F6|nr:vomeronasal type-1 receptor 4-like [Phacochoerus africanus]
MASVDVTTDVIILIQTVVGLLGNFSHFCHYIILYFTRYRSRSTDVILQHLTLANFLALLSKGVPQTMAAFGCKLSPSDFGCKMIFFLHRVGRGVSMGSICLLSVFQVITISPQNSRWAELKAKAPEYIVPSMCLCWMLQMLVNVVFPVNITGKYSDKNITNRRDFGYCSALRYDETRSILLALLLLLPDVSCLGLMLWASGSMVFLLYRHKQQVQHIRRNIISPRSSPESRATRTILLLVSSFVSFYTLACTFQLVLALFGNPSWFLVKITIVMAAWFPTVSPFLLMSRDLTVHRIYVAWIRNAQSPTVRRNL